MRKIQSLLAKKEFTFLKQLQKQFKSAEVFLVGGIIRDVIIGRESKDYDFVIRNVPINKLQAWLKKHGWVDLVGKNFGVFKFIPKGFKMAEPIDIALPRTEHAFLTGGYRDFTVQSDPNLPIKEDLTRRDFTINALAYDIKKGKLIDLFKGLEDIKKERIKTVGLPEERFIEDYSRMLRALRFACQLNFAIEPKTWRTIKSLMSRINKKIGGQFIVPREVIAKEMVKAFVADPVRAFELFDQSKATTGLMPELNKMKKCPQPKNFHSEGDVWQHTVLCLKNLSSKEFQNKFGKGLLSPELVLATVFHDLGKPYTIKRMDRLRFNNHDNKAAELAQKISKRLKLSNAGINIDRVVWLAKKHMIVTHTKHSVMKKTTIEKYFYNNKVPGLDLLKLTFADIQATVPPSGKPDFTGFKRLEKQVNDLKIVSKKKKTLPKEVLNGNEIMKALKLQPSPEIGRLKDLLREEQLKGKIKTKPQALNWLKKHV